MSTAQRPGSTLRESKKEWQWTSLNQDFPVRGGQQSKYLLTDVLDTNNTITFTL